MSKSRESTEIRPPCILLKVTKSKPERVSQASAAYKSSQAEEQKNIIFHECYFFLNYLQITLLEMLFYRNCFQLKAGVNSPQIPFTNFIFKLSFNIE